MTSPALSSTDLDAFVRTWMSLYSPTDDSEYLAYYPAQLSMIYSYGACVLEEWGWDFANAEWDDFDLLAVDVIDDQGEPFTRLDAESFAHAFAEFSVTMLRDGCGKYVESLVKAFLAGSFDEWPCHSDPVDCQLFVEFLIH